MKTALSPSDIDLAARKKFRSQADLWEKHIHAFVETGGAKPYHPGPATGPLSGVTVGVKDIIDVAGMKTRNGSETCAGVTPAEQDATIVAALRRTGAQIMGKTVTTEFAFTDPTACRNPYDVARTPGGSSSGSGAAVAAGLVDIALGTQTAGSLNRPAAYCGVVGFKPSYALLSTAGVTPLSPSFDTLGVMAKSAAMVRRVFTAVQPDQMQIGFTVAGQKLRCGFWDSGIRAEDDARGAYHDAMRALRSLGAICSEASFSIDFDRLVAAHGAVMTHEAALAHADLLREPSVGLLKPKFRMGLQSGTRVSSDQAAAAMAELDAAKRVFWQELADVDLILTLAVPDGAPLIDGTTGFQNWLAPWTAFGGPLISVPWGLDRLRRPRSVMLAARPGQDMRLLETAEELQLHAPAMPEPVLPNAG